MVTSLIPCLILAIHICALPKDINTLKTNLEDVSDTLISGIASLNAQEAEKSNEQGCFYPYHLSVGGLIRLVIDTNDSVMALLDVGCCISFKTDFQTTVFESIRISILPVAFKASNVDFLNKGWHATQLLEKIRLILNKKQQQQQKKTIG